MRRLGRENTQESTGLSASRMKHTGLNERLQKALLNTRYQRTKVTDYQVDTANLKIQELKGF